MSKFANQEMKYTKLLKDIDIWIEEFSKKHKDLVQSIDMSKAYKSKDDYIYNVVSATTYIYDCFREHTLNTIYENKETIYHLKGFWMDQAKEIIKEEVIYNKSATSLSEFDDLWILSCDLKLRLEFPNSAVSVLKPVIIKEMLENKKALDIVFESIEKAYKTYYDVDIAIELNDIIMSYVIMYGLKEMIKIILGKIKEFPKNQHIPINSLYKKFIKIFVNELHDLPNARVLKYITTQVGTIKIRKIFHTFDSIVLETINNLFKETEYTKDIFDFMSFFDSAIDELSTPGRRSLANIRKNYKATLPTKRK